MSFFVERLAAVTRLFSRWLLYLSAVGLVIMTVVIGWQVWGRYVLNDTPHWTERFSLFLMLYYILFAAAVGVHERFHLGLAFFRQMLPASAGRAVDILVNLVVGGFGLFMVWYGVLIAQSTWSHVIPTLGISTGLSYLPFPIAGALITLFCLEHILESLAGREGRAAWK